LVALTTTVVLMKNGLEACVAGSEDFSWAATVSGRRKSIRHELRMGES
jgi:hypothetical protein